MFAETKRTDGPKFTLEKLDLGATEIWNFSDAGPGRMIAARFQLNSSRRLETFCKDS